MPTATKFEAIGRDNGLTRCASEIQFGRFNVLGDPDIQRWTTLGGINSSNYSGGNPADIKSEVYLSLKNYMKLFWNLHKFRATCTTYQAKSTGVVDFTMQDVEITDINEVAIQPKSRVCSAGLFKSKFPPPPWDGSGFYGNIRADIKPRWMYYGDTDNEDNFIGLSLPPSDTYSDSGSSYASARVILGGYTSAEDINSTGSVYIRQQSDFKTIEGIPFVIVCSASGNSGSGDKPTPSVSVDTNAMTASATGYGFGTPSVGICNTSIQGLDFYTY